MADAVGTVMETAVVTMAGAEGTYVVPTDAVELFLYTEDAAIQWRAVTGVAGWLMDGVVSGGPMKVPARGFAGKTLIFFGTGDVRILCLKGSHG